MALEIMEFRRNRYTKKERLSLNEKVQRQRQRIAELEAEINSLGGQKGVAHLRRVARDFDREVKKLRVEYEKEIRELREELRIEKQGDVIAVERITRLERVLERVRSITSTA